MDTDSKNIVNLDFKKEEKILNFSDFQKQSIKFDILKLQEAYFQINLMMEEAFLILEQYALLEYLVTLTQLKVIKQEVYTGQNQTNQEKKFQETLI